MTMEHVPMFLQTAELVTLLGIFFRLGSIEATLKEQDRRLKILERKHIT